MRSIIYVAVVCLCLAGIIALCYSADSMFAILLAIVADAALVACVIGKSMRRVFEISRERRKIEPVEFKDTRAIVAAGAAVFKTATAEAIVRCSTVINHAYGAAGTALEAAADAARKAKTAAESADQATKDAAARCTEAADDAQLRAFKADNRIQEFSDLCVDPGDLVGGANVWQCAFTAAAVSEAGAAMVAVLTNGVLAQASEKTDQASFDAAVRALDRSVAAVRTAEAALAAAVAALQSSAAAAQ